MAPQLVFEKIELCLLVQLGPFLRAIYHVQQMQQLLFVQFFSQRSSDLIIRAILPFELVYESFLDFS